MTRRMATTHQEVNIVFVMAMPPTVKTCSGATTIAELTAPALLSALRKVERARRLIDLERQRSGREIRLVQRRRQPEPDPCAARARQLRGRAEGDQVAAVEDGDVIGEARLLKVGKRLAVGEVTLFTEGESDPGATGLYNIIGAPPSTKIGEGAESKGRRARSAVR